MTFQTLAMSCSNWEDRAAGICGSIPTVTTMSKKATFSPGVCVRGVGGPCTYVADSKGVSKSVASDHSSADSTCSSWDDSAC
mmetsp:Transcript_41654/g.102174  ORF Transcript_41654/g.102174 Transcript_41654/m.102174 type:complete len:82 (+) Transcript_41654:91-336(+)